MIQANPSSEGSPKVRTAKVYSQALTLTDTHQLLSGPWASLTFPIMATALPVSFLPL